jgi:hypothetical protein
MNREIHVRFSEGLRVQFPWATHLHGRRVGPQPLKTCACFSPAAEKRGEGAARCGASSHRRRDGAWWSR